MTLEALPDRLAEETLAYRRALGAFCTGVCVVTANSAEGPLGLTINSFASVSLEPRLVVWSLDERSLRWDAFAATDHFSVHVLRADDEVRAARFAKGVWRLEAEDYRAGDTAPVLPDVLARFDCATFDRRQVGDHLLIIGRVEAFEAEEGEGLTFFRGRYGTTETQA